MSWEHRFNWPALVPAVLLAAISLHGYLRIRHLDDVGAHATARVVHVAESVDSDDDVVYHPLAYFTAGDRHVPITYEGKATIGDTIEVMYDPDDPEGTAEVDTFWRRWQTTVMFGAGALVMFACSGGPKAACTPLPAARVRR